MQNSWFFLTHLVPRVSERITGYRLVSCFSQSKDELVLEFNQGKDSFFLKASFSSSLPGLSFPETFGRARKNSIDLFNPLILDKVKGLRLFLNERSFLIEMESGCALLFRVHGASGNIFLVSDGVVTDAFRKNLKTSPPLNPLSLDRQLDFSPEAYVENPNDPEKQFFTFTREVWLWLKIHGFNGERTVKQWSLISEALREMNRGVYYRLLHENRHYFSLLPFGTIEETWSDPISAITEYSGWHYRNQSLINKRTQLTSRIRTLSEQTIRYLGGARKRLEEIQSDDSFRISADLIMANMHRISPSDTELLADSFEDQGKLINVRLQPGLSAQKNAENYYRKAKNRTREITFLTENIRSREFFLNELSSIAARVSVANNLKAMEIIGAELPVAASVESAEVRLPYTEYLFDGYQIWVGRSSSDNDELTFKFGKKDDLWLHARDCPGSHVILKKIPGKNFPKTVMEFAASLAAAHSKRKGESLCPVSWCEKKFVRKRKGDPPGLVVMDREEVVMVEPYREK